jgi:hypothetical protein
MASKFHRWWLGSCVAALLLASWVGGFSLAVTSVFIVIYLTGVTLIGPDDEPAGPVDVVAAEPAEVVAAEPVVVGAAGSALVVESTATPTAPRATVETTQPEPQAHTTEPETAPNDAAAEFTQAEDAAPAEAEVVPEGVAENGAEDDAVRDPEDLADDRTRP